MQVITGYLMMGNSAIPEERKYVGAIKNLFLDQKSILPDEDRSMAKYINSLSENNMILADDAMAYRIIALSGSAEHFLIPAQKTFLAALEVPKGNVNYILMPNLNNPYQNFSLLNSEVLGKFQDNGVSLKKIRQNERWILYGVNP